MAWPTLSEASAALIDMGFYESSIDEDTGVETKTCSIGDAILRSTLQAEAIAKLESATGFKPLLASTHTVGEDTVTVETTVKFDVPNPGVRMLFIRKPLCSITSIVINGATLAENTDYWVTEDDGLVKWIEFNRLPIYRMPKAIEITGVWARYTDVPAALKGCALRVMCAMAVIEFREGKKALPVRWQDGDVSESYGERMLEDAGEPQLAMALADAQSICFNAGAFF